jgi:hypothetical protein
LPEPPSSIFVHRSPLQIEVQVARPEGSSDPRLLVVMGGHATTPDALFDAVADHLTAAEQAQVRLALGVEETRG